MKCPSCSTENLEGADSCENCGQSLTALDTVIEPQSELEHFLMEETFATVPLPQAVCISPELSIFEAAKQMNAQKVGCVLVLKDRQLVGIVSERDILYKAFRAPETKLSAVPVATIMTPNPESLHKSDTLAYALNRMSLGGYRHIPIIEDNDVIGLVSVTNLLKYITQRLPS